MYGVEFIPNLDPATRAKIETGIRLHRQHGGVYMAILSATDTTIDVGIRPHNSLTAAECEARVHTTLAPAGRIISITHGAS